MLIAKLVKTSVIATTLFLVAMGKQSSGDHHDLLEGARYSASGPAAVAFD
jgi:hypothetical protein